MARKTLHRSFGSVRKLPSGRYQARYVGTDQRRYSARRSDGGPLTFQTRSDADAWLALRHTEILRHDWLPPTTAKATPVTLRAYCEAWLAERTLAIRTRELYRRSLDNHILPTFGNVPVASITPAEIRTWHTTLSTRTGPTATAHAYSLIKTILGTAVTNEVAAANPCHIPGAGQSTRAKQIRPASLAELREITEAMPERLQLMVLLGAWCALRLGEIGELRRSDVDLNAGTVTVRRAVSWADGGPVVKTPKSQAGVRDVAIPPHMMPMVTDHLSKHTASGQDALLFPGAHGGHISEQTVRSAYSQARKNASRPDLRFHDLRHTGAVLAASTGATLAELMARLGHTTPGAALRYQHAAPERDRVIADALSQLAG